MFGRSLDVISAHRSVARWLLLIAAMVFIMVVIGGVTRLTDSGLSIVNWRPITGWLPPLNDADWQAIFALYKETPQFKKVFPDLTLAGFKGIFWLEYIHRVWGRLIGLAFILGFAYLLYRRRVSLRVLPHLLLLLFLGGAQGALGWYMVKSGLVDQPSVSHYRLAAHLILAMIIYVYAVYLALGILRPRGSNQERLALRVAARLMMVSAGLAILWGAFVAGMDAGKIHNTFPLMGGRLIPADYFQSAPLILNLFENPVAVQFNHRVLAMLTTVLVVLVWILAWTIGRAGNIRVVSSVLLLAVALQVGLGIATLLAFVPIWLGALHQAGAMILLTALVWFRHAMHRGINLKFGAVLSGRRSAISGTD